MIKPKCCWLKDKDKMKKEKEYKKKIRSLEIDLEKEKERAKEWMVEYARLLKIINRIEEWK